MQLNEFVTEAELSQDQGEEATDLEGAIEPLERPTGPHRRSSEERKATASPPGLQEVGIIYGNVGTSSFNIMLTGPVDKLEYIQTEHEQNGWILGQIMEIERKTDLSLERVPELKKGTHIDIEEKEIAQVNLIGYRDDRNLLQSPKTPLKAGSIVYKASEELIKSIIGLEEHTDTGAYIGLLLGHEIRIELDINLLVQKHVSILAKTGAGKSYCSGALVEELMKHNVTTVIIDSHGEYRTLGVKGKLAKGGRDFDVTPRGYGDKIIEFACDTTLNRGAHALRFTLAGLDARDILSLTSIKNVRSYLTMLRKTLDMLREAKEEYSMRDIIDLLVASEDSAAASLIAELEYLDETGIFADKGTKIDELVKKGRTTIINLKGAAPDIQELVVNRLTSSLFELRKANKIPPLMLVVEEAHNYCPQQGKSACLKILRTIASEGRKFGLGMTIITQRAAKVDKNILSQCNTQVILKVTNPNDLKAIASSIEGLTPGMEDEIQRLPIGTAIVTGGGVSMPLLVEIRPRETKHGGDSVEIIPSKRI
ncbi:MAG TPA: ATP-binding protein [Euryarchaeota archaeon]|nr:ATP-binding protein [Euryarchaeota archaeon]